MTYHSTPSRTVGAEVVSASIILSDSVTVMIAIGAHVDSADPLTAAKALGAGAAQFFLADPQGWKKPEEHPLAASIKASDIAVYVHAPYIINVASVNNRIRIPSRKILAQHAVAAANIGAKGLIVHGGHVASEAELEKGFENWRKVFERAECPLPILIENTAGGNHAIARRLDHLARLWEAVGEFGAGFCLDTCHAYASGEDLTTIVERIMAITGRIDLVHANSSRDEFASGADRHANFESGTIEAEQIAAVCKAAGSDVIVETPGAGQVADLAFLKSRLG